ncbi:hypothetical protein [Capnocytophaga cynodegmi]|nr:hypothetical protein [Capnocytophaga cynodegmi]
MVGLNASTSLDCFDYAIEKADAADANGDLSHDEYTKILNDAQADCWQNNQKEEG